MFVAFRQNIINSASLTLKESLLALNHCYKILRSWVTFFAKTSSDLPDCSILLSPAKWYAFAYLTHLCRSLMYIRKKSGSRTEPWGTLVKTVLVVEFQLSIDGNCFLFVK